MGVERPTFSESWYRVANLRPRLRSSLQTSRQHFRGQRWHVIRDPSNNQFFRLSEAAYAFVAMLDGRRTVSEVWHICNEQLGDGAPTQGEAIQLLGQLYASNLLQAELAPDAESLFNRYRKRKHREIQSFVSNLLFVHFPLIDPDRFLNRWVGIFGRLFTVWGLAAWMIVVSVGLFFVISNWSGMVSYSERLFSYQTIRQNMVYLYACLVAVKILHEFGHAFACKRFGQLGGTRGEVHVMGVMFLVGVPLPYVDATSVWEFGRNKWHRVVVGAAGMIVELALASVAAIIWSQTRGTVAGAVSYNVMFICSVSTLLFNGNPLLRFDAYYILSDILEIPNLSNRSREYLQYLVKKYAWGVRHLRNPAHTEGEKRWFVFYGLAATVYRVFIVVRILLFVADKIFFLGAILALAAAVAWLLVPLYKFVHYLATSGELMRVRARAVGTTLAAFVLVAAGVGVVPYPDRYRLEGVVEPDRLALVHAEADGFLRDFQPTDVEVKSGAWVVKGENFELERERDELLSKLEGLTVRWRSAVERNNSWEMRAYGEQMQSTQELLRMKEERLAGLTVHSRVEGTWVAPDVQRSKDTYLRRGNQIGLVASLDAVIIRSVADQEFPIDKVFVDQEVEIRVKGRPEPAFRGVVREVLPAGQTRLPSQALGYAAGGPVRTNVEDRQGTEAMESFFEIHIAPIYDPDGRVRGTDGETEVRLLSGQRVAVRLGMPKRPLAAQWWQSLQQLILKRFRV